MLKTLNTICKALFAVVLILFAIAVYSVNHPEACKPGSDPTIVPTNKQPDEVLRCPSTWGAVTYLTFGLVLVGGIQTIVFAVQARKLAETIETMKTISHDQSCDVARSIAEASRAASAMENVALAMNEQRKLMHGQQAIMESQRDISFVTQRAWISAVVKVAGPIKASKDTVFGLFNLEFWNSGSLPANVAVASIAGLPWDQNLATSQGPRIDGVIGHYVNAPLERQNVIFPRQFVVQPFQIAINKSEISISSNTLGGFVLVIRGAIKYDFPGDTRVHYTTFHFHVVKVVDRENLSSWSSIPIEEGVVPEDCLFATNWMGKTEAT